MWQDILISCATLVVCTVTLYVIAATSGDDDQYEHRS